MGRAEPHPLTLRPLPFERTLVVAHRGGRHSGLAENSIAAFEYAIRAGTDMIEFDVRRTHDGVIVAHHDARLGTEPIAQIDHAHLRALAPEVPTLDEIVQHCAGRVLLDLELKEAGYEREVTAILRNRVNPPDLVVTSFLDEALVGMRAAWPEVRRGLIIGSNQLSSLLPFARMRRCGADFLVPLHPLLRLGVRRSAAQRGVPLMVWTVNQPRLVARLLGARGIAAVITDEPVLALDLRRRQQLDHSPGPVDA